ncbi:alpha/beta fold hydrolase [Pseudonocardia endophytica]|uniref:TAP-like protein n=1 Tax=Pseudonocardia endophytica TaxID=401976 RepID=A0A4R1HVA3_PSEEN|nr:alpha/beta fold hydrolase [Pseudonocardia endophytica]TCK24915.1 TAP-like protein [Pseudonocardia endophytica]
MARALLVLAAVLAVVTLAGCTVGPSERPPVAVRGDALTSAPPPAPGAPPPASDPNALPAPDPARDLPGLSDCTADTLATLTADGRGPRAGRALQVACGQLSVPVDPAQPALGPTRVGLTRVTTPGARAGRPPLVVVGDVGTDGAAREAAALAGQVSDRVLSTYQVIGMDRRGTGANLLDCSPPDARASLVDLNPDRTDEGSLTALLDKSRAIVQDCYLLLSGALSSYRASVTADDLETVRRQLGVQRLNVVGVGDGADAVAAWATAHADSVGRVVLDGPSDPTRQDPDSTEDATRAAEAAFDQFALSCRSGPSCPLGPDPRATVTALVGRVAARPLPTPDGDRVTAGAVLLAVRSGLAEPRRWPQLSAALAAAGSGNPAGLLGLLLPEAGPQGRFDAALATRCNDDPTRLTPPEAADLAARWKGSYPLFGAQAAQQLVTCAPWPAPAPSPAAGPLPADAPPVLVLGTTHDPRAPLTGAQRLAELTGAGRLVRWEGSGTGAYPRTPCVSGAVDRALVDGVAPAQDVVCPP